MRLICESLNTQIGETNLLQHCASFPRPSTIVQFVKNNNSTLRHAWQKILKTHQGRLIEIQIEMQQRNDRLWLTL